MDEQQVLVILQPAGVGRRRAGGVAFLVPLRGRHVALGVDGVVLPPVRHRRDGHAGAEHVGAVAREHRHERQVAAVAPAPDADAPGVDVGLAAEPPGHGDLVLRFEHPEPAIGAGLERFAASARAAVVHRGDDHAQLVGQVPVPEVARAAPGVADLLAAGAAVDVHEHRVGPPGVEAAGADDGGQQRRAVGARHLGELGRGQVVGRHALGERRVVFERLELLAVGAMQRHDRRRRHIRERVDVVAVVARQVDAVRAGALRDARRRCGRGALPRLERRAVEVPLGRAVERAGEVEDPGCLVHAQERIDLPVAFGEAAHEVAVVLVEVEVAVAVGLAAPDEVAAVVEEGELGVLDVDPGFLLLLQHRLDRRRLRVAVEQVEVVLVAVQAEHPHARGAVDRRRPAQARDVFVGIPVVPGAGVEVAHGVRLRVRLRVRLQVHDAHLRLAVRLARLRVAEARQRRVLLAQVGHHEVARGCFVELQESDVAAVRAPGPGVAQPELLLVDPVRGAVDDAALGAVVGQARLAPGGEVHHEEIAVAHERHAVAARAELGEHLEARRAVADGPQRLRGQLVDVVVALRVVAPDALGVGEEQHALAVRAVLVALDPDEPAGVGRAEVVAVDEPGARVGLQVVAHQVGGGAVTFDVGDDRAGVGPAAALEAAGGEPAAGVDVFEREPLVLAVVLLRRRGEGRRKARKQEQGDEKHRPCVLAFHTDLALVGRGSTDVRSGKTRFSPHGCSACAPCRHANASVVAGWRVKVSARPHPALFQHRDDRPRPLAARRRTRAEVAE